MSSNPATVTVVTGPLGVDIGPAAAWLARSLGDGLAVRTVQPGTLRRRTSPVPPNMRSLRNLTVDTVDLHAVPSAWQNPDTNLGVAVGTIGRSVAGYVDTLDGIRDDLLNFERLGLNPAYRLTVQGVSPAHHIWPGVEYGDLATIARDSVLRASAGGSRHVLIEAGDGQTFLDAVNTVGLQPWACIDHLDLQFVVDAGAGADVLAQQLAVVQDITEDSRTTITLINANPEADGSHRTVPRCS